MRHRLLLLLLCLAVLAVLPRLAFANDPWDAQSGSRLERGSDVAGWRDWNSPAQVMRSTGKIYTIRGLRMWSPDRSRSADVA